jgi:hypothetical protein
MPKALAADGAESAAKSPLHDEAARSAAAPPAATPGPAAASAPVRAVPRNPPTSAEECDRQLAEALLEAPAITNREALQGLVQQCRERFRPWDVPDRLRTRLEQRLNLPERTR